MTTGFGEYFLTFNFRNGVGLDLEFTDSRPVWISDNATGSVVAASFEGTVVLVPFVIIKLGKIYQEV